MQYLKQQVRKFFKGHGYFVGQVTKVDEGDAFPFTVTYNDGDQETITLKELKRILVSAKESAQKQKSPRLAEAQLHRAVTQSHTPTQAVKQKARCAVASPSGRGPARAAQATAEPAGNKGKRKADAQTLEAADHKRGPVADIEKKPDASPGAEPVNDTATAAAYKAQVQKKSRARAALGSTTTSKAGVAVGGTGTMANAVESRGLEAATISANKTSLAAPNSQRAAADRAKGRAQKRLPATAVQASVANPVTGLAQLADVATRPTSGQGNQRVTVTDNDMTCNDMADGGAQSLDTLQKVVNMATRLPKTPQTILRMHPSAGGRARSKRAAVYHQLVVRGNTAYLAGQTATDFNSASGRTYKGQAKEVFASIERLLKEAGSSKDLMLSALVHLKNIEEGVDEFNAAWVQWLQDSIGSLPVRTVVQGAMVHPDMLVEITVVAAIKDA